MTETSGPLSKSDLPSVSANPLGKIGWMLAASLTFRISSGVTTLALAFFLTVADYGAFMNAIFWSLMIVLLAGSGLPDLIVRDGSRAKAHPIPEQLGHAWFLCLILGTFSLTCLLVALNFSGLPSQSWLLVLLAGIAAIVTALNYIAQAALRLTGRIIWQARIMMVTALLTNGGLLTFAVLGHPVLWLGYWYILAFLSIMILHLAILSRFNMFALTRLHTGRIRQMAWQTLPFGLAPVLMMLLPVLSSSLALHHMTSDLAGSFNLMLSIYLAALAVSLVLDQVFFPMISEVGSNARARMSGYVITALSISLPSLILFSWLGPDLAWLIFAGKYPQLDLLLPILGLLIPIRFTSHAFTVSLRRLGRQRYTIVAYGFGTMVMVLISVTFPDLLSERPPLQIFGLALLAGEGTAFALLAVSAAHQMEGRLFFKGFFRLALTILASAIICQISLEYGTGPILALFTSALAFLVVGLLVRLPGFIARDCVHQS